MSLISKRGTDFTVSSRDFADFKKYLAILLVSYIGVYGTFLIATDFFPYVMDNNESFSSLWHAFNIYQFGILDSAGLADEAFSPHAAAHPYVHTHQGNFPRLYALLIYLLGARSVESQIAVTTFTIGLAAVCMAYRYFSKVGNALFAFLACLVMMTDYILFAQWQVVTYRVWYGFFFFSTLVCAHYISVDRSPKWIVLTILNYAAVFYFELVYGAFLTILAGCYVAFVNLKSPAIVIRAWFAQAAGMLLGLGIFFAQWVGYLGWEGFIKDLFFTFVARNEAGRNPELLLEIKNFYENNNVAFWYNFKDGATLSTLWAYVRSFFLFNWQVYTPLFSLLVIMIAGSWLISFVHEILRGETIWRNLRGALSAIAFPATFVALAVVFSWWNEWMQHGTTSLSKPDTRMMLGVVLGGVFVLITMAYASAAAMRVFFAASIYLVCSAIFTQERIHGISSTAAPWYKADASLGVVFSIIFSVLLYCVAHRIFRLRALAETEGYEPDLQVNRIIRVATLCLLGVAFFVRFHRVLYDQSYADLWRYMLDGWFPGLVAQLVVVSAVIVVLIMLAYGARVILGETSKEQLIGLLPILAAFLIAYSIIYVLSPGYVYTGYLERYAPFGVFVQSAIVAIAIYVALKNTIYWGVRGRLLSVSRSEPPQIQLIGSSKPEGGSFDLITTRFVAIASAFLTVFMVGYWAKIQLAYTDLLPPNHYSFIKNLADHPYFGRSFVVDNYAGPPAWFTQEWAYYDPSIASGKLTLTDAGYKFERSRKYIWLADRDSNNEYEMPDYFLCMQPQSMRTAAESIKRKEGEMLSWTGCQTRNVVRRALQNKDKFPRYTIAGIDTDGLHRQGYAKWAIVKLDWNYPPYLKKMGNDDDSARVNIAVEKSSGDRVQIRPVYRYAQQNGLSEQDTIFRFYEIGHGSACPDGDMSRRAIAELRGTSKFMLRQGFNGKIQLSVIPGSVAGSGKEYYSNVILVNDKGDIESCINGLPPDKPSKLESLRKNPTTILLTWNDVHDVTRYKIEMRREEGDFVLIGERNAEDVDAAEYTIGDLNPGQIYQFRIRSCNRYGCSMPSKVSER